MAKAGAKRRMVLGGTPADLSISKLDIKLDILRSKLAGSAIDVNEEQPEKAPSPRLVRPVGSVIDVIEEQFLKALLPMLVRPAGSSIDVNEEQSWKAHSPRLVRPAGSSIDVNEEQP
jgi:hypothetical protein